MWGENIQPDIIRNVNIELVFYESLSLQNDDTCSVIYSFREPCILHFKKDLFFKSYTNTPYFIQRTF